MKLIVLLASILSFGFHEFQSNEESISNGSVLYYQNCTPCHSLDENIIGPALRDIHLKRDSAWLFRWTTRSQKLIESGDTAAVAIFNKHNRIVQPDFKLSATQVDDIYKYIKAARRK